jgi:putative ABC transport system ATP-binding protein
MISMNGITKVYRTGQVTFAALRGITLEVADNEFIAVVGPSGSGKSTLMNLMGCLDTPTEGNYLLAGEEVETLSPNQLAEIRNRRVGFVFQAFNLLPYATTYENVELPLIFAGARGRDRRRRVTDLLCRVGLADKMGNKPTELSGGEMQRVAIARALANNPKLILADEPTGNLDSRASVEIMDLLHHLHEQGATIVMVTHELDIAQHAQRVICVKDGRVISEGRDGHSPCLDHKVLMGEVA